MSSAARATDPSVIKGQELIRITVVRVALFQLKSSLTRPQKLNPHEKYTRNWQSFVPFAPLLFSFFVPVFSFILAGEKTRGDGDKNRMWDDALIRKTLN